MSVKSGRRRDKFKGEGMAWTDERVALLKKRWAEGKSGDQIAMEIGGVSRNAVIGKAHRLGLGRHSDAGGLAKTQRRAKAMKSNARRFGLQALANTPQKIKAVAAAGGKEAWIAKHIDKPAPPPPPIPEPRAEQIARVTFADLESNHCKFPVGEVGKPDFGFCGLPRVEGQPYCVSCCQIAFTPRQPRPKPLPVVPSFEKAMA